MSHAPAHDAAPDDETGVRCISGALAFEVPAAEFALAELVRAAMSHASRLETMAHEHRVPMSTLRALIAQDHGPKTFVIGRLVFVRRKDWNVWIDALARTGGARLSSKSAAADAA